VADTLSVSVILPTHNRPRLLAEAVGSVLAQQRQPEQLIVVDDSSTGEPARVLEGLGRPCTAGVTVIRGPGRGPGAARNAGLRAAQCDLVAFLDDDDLWHPRKLELQLPAFERAPSLGVLGTTAAGGPGLPQTGSAQAGASRGGRLRAVALGSLVRANRLVMSSVVARRACLEGCGGFDESLALAQDWDLWLRAARNWQVAALTVPLVCYRRHSGQRSADAAAMRWWEGEVLRRALARGLPGRRLEGIARRRLAWSHLRLGRLLSGVGEAELAREQFREATALCRWSPLAWLGLVRCGLAARAPARARP
jgi:glycosyltransferase involved in cell wall biosynthesis